MNKPYIYMYIYMLDSFTKNNPINLLESFKNPTNLVIRRLYHNPVNVIWSLDDQVKVLITLLTKSQDPLRKG